MLQKVKTKTETEPGYIPDDVERDRWLTEAERLRPELCKWTVHPVGIVEPDNISGLWQGTGLRRIHSYLELRELRFSCKSGPVYLELPESVVGYLTLDVIPEDYCDSPIRIRVIMAELPYEVMADYSNFSGNLSRSWLQDEVVTIETLPDVVTIPRRCAMRYIRLEIVAGSAGDIRFRDVYVTAQSAVGPDLPVPPPGLSPLRRNIYTNCMRTLRNCIQEVFEDGPKRDRRLWLGDLQLQALVNAVSYRRFDLVERSIYLLAAMADEDGWIPGCIYEHPNVKAGDYLVDYSLIFCALLSEHCRNSGNLALGRELFRLAKRQIELRRNDFDADGIFRGTPDKWIFIDWSDELDRQMSLQGVYIFAHRKMADLARRLGYAAEEELLEREAARLSRAVRRFRFDQKRFVIVSGPEKQVSLASHIWMIRAGVFSPEEGRRLLTNVFQSTETVMPVTPYLHHQLLEAYQICGEREKADALIDTYWGGMAATGADTFFEIYVPGNDFMSPYGTALLNSACHAWSCTPVLFMTGH